MIIRISQGHHRGVGHDVDMIRNHQYHMHEAFENQAESTYDPMNGKMYLEVRRL
jgi:hypothetical protein